MCGLFEINKTKSVKTLMDGMKLLDTKIIEDEEGMAEEEVTEVEVEENIKTKEEDTKIITLTFSDKQTKPISNPISIRKISRKRI